MGHCHRYRIYTVQTRYLPKIPPPQKKTNKPLNLENVYVLQGFRIRAVGRCGGEGEAGAQPLPRGPRRVARVPRRAHAGNSWRGCAPAARSPDAPRHVSVPATAAARAPAAPHFNQLRNLEATWLLTRASEAGTRSPRPEPAPLPFVMLGSPLKPLFFLFL